MILEKFQIYGFYYPKYGGSMFLQNVSIYENLRPRQFHAFSQFIPHSTKLVPEKIYERCEKRV